MYEYFCSFLILSTQFTKNGTYELTKLFYSGYHIYYSSDAPDFTDRFVPTSVFQL